MPRSTAHLLAASLLGLLLGLASPAGAAVLAARGRPAWAPRQANDHRLPLKPHDGTAAPTPIVVWHGLGDSCCNPQSIGAVVDAIEEHLPGARPPSAEASAVY